MSLRDYIYLAAIAVLGCALWWFGWHERAIGEAEIKAHDVAAVAAQQRAVDAAVAKQHDTDLKAVADYERELKALASVSLQPIPIVRLCRGPASGSSLPTAADTPNGTPEGATAAGSTAGVPSGVGIGPDIGAGLQLIARVGDKLAAQERATVEWVSKP